MNLEDIWKEFQSYNGRGSKNFELPGCRAQFYKGAMEIPLIAFYPAQPFDLNESKLSELSAILAAFGHKLDCVQENGNYKINRSEDGQYLGRITNDALKLHAERIKELGWEPFSKIALCQLGQLS